MCKTIGEGCQVILDWIAAVAYAAYSLAKHIDANAKAEREKFELTLQRHRQEVIYQSNMNTLATLVQSKDPIIWIRSTRNSESKQTRLCHHCQIERGVQRRFQALGEAINGIRAR